MDQADAQVAPPPFVLHAPARQTTPLVFTSPHSGRYYPPGFLRRSRLDPLTLRRSEDCFVEELAGGAPALGAPLLEATFPRALIDANREPWELDPAMFAGRLPDWVNTRSPRVGAGLGTIPRIISSGETIHAGKLDFAEASRWIEAYWHPWHAALAGLIEQTRARFGVCMVVDCHSMPSSAAAGAEIVLGDGHGTTCAAAVTDLLEQEALSRHYAVRRNDPYAGGYITRHYGNPAAGLHAIQIEFSRRLYMDERRMTKLAGFARLKDDTAKIFARLADAVPALLAQG